MLIFINIVIAFAVISVVGILIFGMITMARGDDAAKAKSNVIMRWRVGVQALAMVAILVGFYLKSKLNGS